MSKLKFGRKEIAAVSGPIAFIGIIHIIAFGSLWYYSEMSALQKTLSFGLGITAYLLGLRHAFDADHIAAIDNTTRNLIDRGQKPTTVGLWFALGHSTIVFAMAVIIALGVRSGFSLVSEDSSAHHMLDIFGTLISGIFLLIIALTNLIGLIKNKAQYRPQGLVTKLLGAITPHRPIHMYGVGLLFGLGFDTATEIALLLLTGTMASHGFVALIFPALFTAGMTMMDFLDGLFMSLAYRWAFSDVSVPVSRDSISINGVSVTGDNTALARPHAPVSRVSRHKIYNYIVTGVSIAVAVIISTVSLIQFVNVPGKFGDWFSELSLDNVGFMVVGFFLLFWLSALTVAYLRRPKSLS